MDPAISAELRPQGGFAGFLFWLYFTQKKDTTLERGSKKRRGANPKRISRRRKQNTNEVRESNRRTESRERKFSICPLSRGRKINNSSFRIGENSDSYQDENRLILIPEMITDTRNRNRKNHFFESKYSRFWVEFGCFSWVEEVDLCEIRQKNQLSEKPRYDGIVTFSV